MRADGGYAAVAAVEDEMGCCRWPAARDGLPDQRRKYSNLPPKFTRTFVERALIQVLYVEKFSDLDLFSLKW